MTVTVGVSLSGDFIVVDGENVSAVPFETMWVHGFVVGLLFIGFVSVGCMVLSPCPV